MDASLWKILGGPSLASKGAFLNDGGGKKNVLLVIAHPDDESMFFAPDIGYLISQGHNLHVLCISTGNANGLGDTRKEELYLASAVLKISTQQAKVLDHPGLQIINFDDFGVSGHCNHRDVHRGVRELLHKVSDRHLEAWALASNKILRKYIGPVDIWLSILFAKI
ncbi:probable N-acetylglucosaminyl-phosphatidylinositol de-N-acetylase [Andrographis paniculata]|uniref:probable N-acetylglucosaminyl-phosphatidylinositol de-N-acetylase n=1 Tax=Andrographis paniculata TaxID=175694 RepID=UPI0021E86E3E|nr:probable N-acetylglucosaminyl-phosphatidylinositol de-N-acetylase [Andrographis paniculata]